MFVGLSPGNALAPAVSTVIVGGLINFSQSTLCLLSSPKFGVVWPFIRRFIWERCGWSPTALIRIYGTLTSRLCRCWRQLQSRTKKTRLNVETQVIKGIFTFGSSHFHLSGCLHVPAAASGLLTLRPDHVTLVCNLANVIFIYMYISTFF